MPKPTGNKGGSEEPLVQTNTELPDPLRPYHFHGMDVQSRYRPGMREVITDCPWCGAEDKFSIKVETGQWRCFICNESGGEGEGAKTVKGGNGMSFLRVLWRMSHFRTETEDYQELMAHRHLLSEDTLVRWGVCKSILTNEWLVPGYGTDGKLRQLYRYVKFWSEKHKAWKWRLNATPTFTTRMMFEQNFDPRNYTELYVCEGPWDAMALEELLRNARLEDGVEGDASRDYAAHGPLTYTTDPDSLRSNVVGVVATPGCHQMDVEWANWLCENKERVTFLYDSDHPHVSKDGRELPPAGWDGARACTLAVASCENPPKTIHVLQWGTDGYDTSLPSGYDVRDAVGGEPEFPGRVAVLSELLTRVVPIPSDWLGGRDLGTAKKGGTELALIPTDKWEDVEAAWKEAMKWTDGLDCACSVMLACVASTPVLGDQLWVQILGPASCGKSTLCEAVSTNRKFVLAKSAIRGFHSGYKSDKSGEEDNSLIKLLYDKTLVTKDGDTLLQSPNLGQILSEARDIYDRVSRSHYRSGLNRNYEGLNVTWILCGTGSLRNLDQSELGERFLKCVIMETIDEDLEDEILWRVAHRTDRIMGQEADAGDASTQNDPDLVYAMQRTGGYVDYLRKNSAKLVAAVEVPEQAMRKIINYGKFVAFARARPSSKQEEISEREFAARLVSQHMRLAKFLAVVLNKPRVDEEVLRRVRKVALDTAHGSVLDIFNWMYEAGPERKDKSRPEGCDPKVLADLANIKEDRCRTLLRFLKKIKAVVNFLPDAHGHMHRKPRWRMTKRMYDLYKTVMKESP